MNLYKPHEISGRVDTELTPELYCSWGRTLGLQVRPGDKFVVGGDVRRETPDFLAALLDGLASAGVDVVLLGILPMPMIYHAAQRLQAAGLASVTASYSPAGIHGLRWRIGGRSPSPEDVQRLRAEAENPSPMPADRSVSKPRLLDVSFDYVSFLQENWVDSRGAECRAVLDPMFGCCSARARRYLQAVFPHSLFSAIHDAPDSTFGGRIPDCTQPENLVELCDAVENERADLGIAFDDDGDRVSFVDNEGVVLTAEETAWILLQSFGAELQGRPFVYDLKFSKQIPEAAWQLGADSIEQSSGYALLHQRMQETQALFGVGLRGHFFFGDLAGDDDGLFAACRLIAHVDRTGSSLADLRRECPAIYMTPDLRVRLDPQEAGATLAEIRELWKKYPQTQLDGVRIEFPDGWALVRPSVTEPALTFRFESSDWTRLHKLIWRFCDRLGYVGDTLWARYEEAVGSRCHPG